MSKLEICNTALAMVNANILSSLEDGSREAELCNKFWDNTRQCELRLHDWNFAYSQSKLTKIGTGELIGEINGYIYDKPAGALTILKTYNFGDRECHDYKLFFYPATGKEIIFTFLDEAWAGYIRDITDTSLYDPTFAYQLSAALALRLAIPLTDSNTIYSRVKNIYELALENARLINKQEVQEELNVDNDYLDIRRKAL